MIFTPPLFMSILRAPRQSVCFAVETPRLVVCFKINTGKFLGSACLATVEDLGGSELLKVVLAAAHLDLRDSSLEVVSPALEIFRTASSSMW